MKRIALTISIIFSLLICACSDKDSVDLKEKIQLGYTFSEKTEKLSSGSKAQYIQMEESINQAYAKDLESLLDTAFERQLEQFEDEELGVWASYKHMFSWLFRSKQSWNDEMNMLSKRYFNTLDINQEQHSLYESYLHDIKNLRQQFISVKGYPSYTQIDLPTETITLEALSDHTRNNLVIEFGTELLEWFLCFVIIQVVLLFLDKIAGGIGCLIDIIVFIIIMIISVVMSNNNDSKLIEHLRQQHSQSMVYDYDSTIKSLDENTIKFYESL